MDKPSLRRIAATELATLDLPERETILDPILDSKSIALLYGPRGLGKTFVALGIAWAAAAGGSFLGWTASRPHRAIRAGGDRQSLQPRRLQIGRSRLLDRAASTTNFSVHDDGNHFTLLTF